MPTLNDVYTKFGETAEAAQLLETQVGNLLIEAAIDTDGENLRSSQAVAKALFEDVDRKTLGQLIQSLRKTKKIPDDLGENLARALSERNRLNHSFYRQHDLRRNSDEGREIMINDLVQIHQCILETYVAIFRLSGIDIENVDITALPTEHLQLNPNKKH